MALRTSLVLMLALAASALVPAGAAAAAWLGSQTLSENPAYNTGAPKPTLVSDAAGDQVVALVGGKGGGAASPQTIQVATRVPGGAWSPLSEIANTTATFVGPALDMDPQGDSILAFVDTTTTTAPCAAGTGCIHLFSRAAGAASFTLEKLVATATGTRPIELTAALDPRGTGNATLLWTRTPSAGFYITEALQRNAGAWSGIQTVLPSSNTESYSRSSAVYDSGGTPVTVVAAESPQGCTVTCTETLRTAVYNGSWNAGQIESSTTERYGQNGGDISLTRAISGEVAAIYVRTNYTTNAQTIRTAVHPISATPAWDSPTTVFTPAAGNTVTAPKMAVALGGAALAAWENSTSTGTQTVVAADRPPGSVFSGPATLDTGAVSLPAVAQDGQGNALVAWFNSTGTMMRFAQRPVGGVLGAAADIGVTSAAGDPDVVSDSSGDFSLVWPSGGTSLAAQVYDSALPTLTLGSLPAGPIYPGDPVDFSATAGDLWSNPVAVHWDFGDGRAADGASVSHSYAAAGSYAAKAVATDAAGNSSTQTLRATIAAAPPSSLPPPVLGVSINLFVVKDPVYIKLPGEKTFHRLIKQAHVPNGTVVDTRKGRVLIVIDNGSGGTDSAEFYDGLFEVNQPKSLHGLANIFLNGGGFKGCPKAPKDPHAQLSSKKKLSPHRSVRHLWGSGTGKFRTVGRFASATVRGTNWLTDDHCDGTLVRVRKGRVSVRDFVKQRTIALPAPKSYFAAAKR